MEATLRTSAADDDPHTTLATAQPVTRRPVAGDGAGPISFWWDSLETDVVTRPALQRDLEVDVAIVGAGFTGLWTAYYLNELDPSLRIAILEAEVAGFGASGRNGGWCSALFAASTARLTNSFGAQAARAMRIAMQDSVDEVGRAATHERIDCHFAKGGTIIAVRSAAQLARTRAEIEEARRLGIGEADLALLSPSETEDRFGATGCLGATFSPHCAAIHPGRLVRGLAEVVAARGVELYESTPVRAIEDRRVRADGGAVRADVIVRATEGYTAQLAGSRRLLAPVYSLMIATAPLPDAAWAEIGLAQRETFGDHRHLVIYGQRTADGRLAFGGRGAPYHFASSIKPAYDHNRAVHAQLAETLGELFPTVRDVEITHRWGGPLGIPRDWFSSVGFDRASGAAWAGGYVGDGVSTTNLAGRTLADLITGRDSALTRLPWVGHRSPRWEPEPLRYLGVNAALAVMTSADAVEERTGRPARRAAWFSKLTGG